MKDNLTFVLFTPDCNFPELECDSVKLNIADSISGKFSGAYGIRKGHAEAVFALAEGIVSVKYQEKVIFSAKCSDGFATVKDNIVSVTVDSAQEQKL